MPEPQKPRRRGTPGERRIDPEDQASTHNVEATFEDEDSARRAAAEADREVGGSVTVDEPRDERAVLRAEMREELESSVVGPGNIGPFTKGMTRGIVWAVPIGMLIGALFGLLVGLIPWGGLSLGLRLVIGAVSGGVAGATAGFVAGGFVKPRLEREGERLEAEEGTTVGVHAERPVDAQRAREVLEERRPKRVDDAGPGARPRGPSSEERTRPVRGE